MATFANSEGPDEIVQIAEFYQGLHCLLKKLIFRERNLYSILEEIITCDPSIHIMNHPDLTVSSFMVNSIGGEGLRVSSFTLYW